MTDETLLHKINRGDGGAFRELYSRYRDPLFRFAYRLTSSPKTAEDLCHDAFLALFRGGFDPQRGTLKTYLFGALRNQARKRFRDLYQEDTSDAEPLDRAAGPLDLLLTVESAGQVRRAIEALPICQREALILFEYEELSLEEIAQITEIEVGAVKARRYRARERLRRTLTTSLKVVSK